MSDLLLCSYGTKFTSTNLKRSVSYCILQYLTSVFLLLVDLKVMYKIQLGLLLVAEDSNQTQPVHAM